MPEVGCAFGGEIAGCNLEVASVEVTLVQHGFSVGCYLLSGAASHEVIGTGDLLLIRAGE